jgi:RNA polymerase sigma-70 factor (ECF subfamily)
MPPAIPDHAFQARLLARLATDDESALDALLEMHWDALIDYALGLNGSLDAAKDAVQEAFIRLWERRSHWERGSLAGPILYRIVRNQAVDQRRAEAVRARGAAVVELNQSVTATPDQTIDEQELAAAVRVALGALSAREREVVVLSRFHGLGRGEIAEVMALAPQTVSNLLSVGLTRLLRALGPYLDDEQAAQIRRRSFRTA